MKRSHKVLHLLAFLIQLRCALNASTCDTSRLHQSCDGPFDDCGCSNNDRNNNNNNLNKNNKNKNKQNARSRRLECAVQAGICARTPRDYGEPCSLADPCGEFSQSNPSMRLRCSTWCGICIADSEDDIQPLLLTGDDESIKQIGGSSRRCLQGLTDVELASSFRTWARTVLSSHPIVMPRNDNQLRHILETSGRNGCHVRPMGSTHSAPGVVATEDEKNILIVSLVNYNPDQQSWKEITVREGRQTVRVPAGKTQLQLYSVIRPRGYFLPTQTAGWLFTMGGIVSNSVHGGDFGKSFLHSYVTALRVMYANGTVAVLQKEEDLRYWRGSFGLLGVITAVEFELERRDTDAYYFEMAVESPRRLDGGWSKASLEEHVQRVKEESLAGQFFFETTTKEIMTVVQHMKPRSTNSVEITLRDDDCIWNYGKASCECISCLAVDKFSACSYQYQFPDLTLSQSCRPIVRPTPKSDRDCVWDYANSKCRFGNHCSYQFEPGDDTLDKSCRLTNPPPPNIQSMKASYNSRMRENPLLGITGSPVGANEKIQNLNCLASRLGLEQLTRRQVMSAVQRLVKEGQSTTNDGFYILEGSTLPVAYLGYLFPTNKLFRVLNEISSLDFVLSVPLNFRFVTLDDSAVLMPGDRRSGEYVALEVSSLEIPEWTPKRWRRQFRDIEQILISAGGFPHTGKYFGMGRDRSDGLIKPFQDLSSIELFSSEAMAEFELYRASVDPEGLFNAGFMAGYLSTEEYW